MPRIAPVQDPDADQERLLAKTVIGGGEPLNVFKTLAHHPRLLKRFNLLGGQFMTGAIDPLSREVVILRVAARTDCEYELFQHIPIAQATGLASEVISKVTDLTFEAELLPEEISHLVMLADELVQTASVSESLWERLESRYSTEGLLELLLLPGFYYMLAGLLNALNVEFELLPTEEQEPHARNSVDHEQFG